MLGSILILGVFCRNVTLQTHGLCGIQLIRRLKGPGQPTVSLAGQAWGSCVHVAGTSCDDLPVFNSSRAFPSYPDLFQLLLPLTVCSANENSFRRLSKT